MSDPLENDGLQKLIDLRNDAEKEYLKTIIDFLKWTTTFTIATIIWVANSYGKNVSSNIMVSFSLFSLIMSLIIAIVTVYLIVLRLGHTWEFLDKSCGVIQETIKEADISICEKLDMAKLTREERRAKHPLINLRVLAHLVTLVVGVLCYVVAIVFLNILP